MIVCSSDLYNLSIRQLKFLLFILCLFTLASCNQAAETLEKRPGLHLLTGGLNPQYTYKYIAKKFNKKDVEDLLEKLDWMNGFHQIIIVKKNNISIEVGGSMHPDHGLSGVYRGYTNKNKTIHLVTNYPPQNINDMKEILVLFMSDDDSWRDLYEFK